MSVELFMHSSGLPPFPDYTTAPSGDRATTPIISARASENADSASPGQPRRSPPPHRATHQYHHERTRPLPPRELNRDCVSHPSFGLSVLASEPRQWNVKFSSITAV